MAVVDRVGELAELIGRAHRRLVPRRRIVSRCRTVSRSSRRQTKRRPDQSSPRAATLTSTRPVSSGAAPHEIVPQVAHVTGRLAGPRQPQGVLWPEERDHPAQHRLEVRRPATGRR